MDIRKLATAAASAVALCGWSGIAGAGQYDGVTINILTRPGPVIAGAVSQRGRNSKS